MAEARGGGGPAMTARASGGHRQDRAAGLIEVLRVNLPEAAGRRLAELTGPAQAWPRAGVGPGSVSW